MSISIKLFVVDFYTIPSTSMENTLYSGDVIMLNKLAYGPRTPRTPFEIPWINIILYFNKKARETMGSDWWKHKRLTGLTQVEKGDIFVFEVKIYGKKTTFVKRCIATPGTIISIKKGETYIDNQFFLPSTKIKNRYLIVAKDKKGLLQNLDSLNVSLELKPNLKRKNSYQFIASEAEINILNKIPYIDSIQRILTVLDTTSLVYPRSIDLDWTLDNYGPLKIPHKGMTIELTAENCTLYGGIIKKHEKEKIVEIEGGFFINNNASYTFKQAYYFMMGDNRKISADSRDFGIIPEKNIVGKVQNVLFSNSDHEFRWDRLMKSVN